VTTCLPSLHTAFFNDEWKWGKWLYLFFPGFPFIVIGMDGIGMGQWIGDFKILHTHAQAERETERDDATYVIEGCRNTKYTLSIISAFCVVLAFFDRSFAERGSLLEVVSVLNTRLTSSFLLCSDGDSFRVGFT